MNYANGQSGFGRKGAAQSPVGSRVRPTAAPSVHRYSVDGKPLALLMMAVLAAGGAVFFGLAAMLDDPAQLISKFRLFSPDVGRVVCGAFTALCLYGIWASVPAFVRSKKISRYITLDQNAVMGPSSLLSNRHVRISYAEIKGIELRKYGSTLWFAIRSINGEKIAFSNAAFESDDAFKECVARVSHARKSFQR